MYRDGWDIYIEEHQQKQANALIQLQETDKQIAGLLDRIVTTQNTSVVDAYESRITQLQEQKMLLEENVKKCRTVLPDFETSFRTAFDFIANPIGYGLRTQSRTKELS